MDIILLIITIIIAVYKFRRSGKKLDFKKWINTLSQKGKEIKSYTEKQIEIEPEKTVFRPDAVQEDEYKTNETYDIKEKHRYKELEEESHDDAYSDKQMGNQLSDLEKGIIFSEILAKPLSLRK